MAGKKVAAKKAPRKARSANAIDVEVGRRLRARRLERRMSQEALAEKLEITFQQIQKYEKGVNRISASTLYDLCLILDVSSDYFFDWSGRAINTGAAKDVELAAILAQLEGEDLDTAIDVVRALLVAKQRKAKKPK